MTTVVTDLAIVPELVANFVNADIRKKSDFFLSGAVVDSPVLFPVKGATVAVPQWNGLSGSADVMGDTAPSANKLDSSVQVGAILQRNKKWAIADVAKDFAGPASPLDALATKVATFWQRNLDANLVAQARGAALGLDSAASGQFVNNISTTTGAVLNAQSIIATRGLLGEYMNDASILVVHPAVYAKLQADQVTTLLPGADGQPIETFQGMQIVVSSTLTSPSTGVYDTLIVRAGSFGFADATDADKVLELDREIGFADQFATQKRWVLHPFGASLKSTAVFAGNTATDAELANSANWELANNAYDFGVRMLRATIVPVP